MKLSEKRTPGPMPKTPGELAADASTEEAKDAREHDRPGGSPLRPEAENLSVVEYKGVIVERSGNPAQFVTREVLELMSAAEIRAVGYDRGYWRRGVSVATKAQIVESFLEHQGDPHPANTSFHRGVTIA